MIRADSAFEVVAKSRLIHGKVYTSWKVVVRGSRVVAEYGGGLYGLAFGIEVAQKEAKRLARVVRAVLKVQQGAP